jgi:hypothetical protein
MKMAKTPTARYEGQWAEGISNGTKENLIIDGRRETEVS